MPPWKLLLVVAVIAFGAIFVLEPDYVELQRSVTVDEFLGVVGDEQRQVMAAGIADMVFALTYGLLGVVAVQHLVTGVVRGLGMGLVIGAAVADLVENVMVVLGAGQGDDLRLGVVDAMGTAGSVKWGLGAAAVVLLLALSGQRLLDRRSHLS